MRLLRQHLRHTAIYLSSPVINDSDNTYAANGVDGYLDTAEANLGVMYYLGNGVEKDYAKAIEWFAKAASNGNVSAQKLLNALKQSQTK